MGQEGPDHSADRSVTDPYAVLQLLPSAHPLVVMRTFRVLADMTDSELDDVHFSLWYLRGKKLVEVGDGDEMSITVAGVDYVEENTGLMEEMLSLPEARGALPEGGSAAPAS